MKLEEALNVTAKRNNLCTAAVVIKDKKILLGNRVYPEKNLSVWNFPGGRCDEGEKVEETIRREVFEEIGIQGNNLEIVNFAGKVKGSWKDDQVMVFICSIYEKPKLMEPEKFKEWQWFDIKEGLEKQFSKEVKSLLKKFLKLEDEE